MKDKSKTKEQLGAELAQMRQRITELETAKSECKRAEEALWETRDYLENLLDYANAPIIVWDPQFRITRFNHAFERLTGKNAGEVLDAPLDILFPEDRREEALAHIHRTVAGEQWEIVEIPILCTDGTVRIVLWNSATLYAQDGTTIIATIAQGQDITERKRAEEALRRRNLELATLNRVARTLGSTLDLDQILAAVLEEVRRLLDVVACSVWLKDAQGDLVCRQVIGPQSEIVRGWRLAPGEGLAGRVALSGESLIVPDVRTDERYFEAVDQQTGLALRSILTLPLRIKQDVIGVIQVVDTEIERFSPADLTLLEPLAMNAAGAIENARLYEQAQRDAETRATLLREVNHRVKNNLTAVMGMLTLEMQRPHREVADLQTILRDLQDRIRGLVTVHDLLSAAQWSPLSLDRLVTGVIQAALNSSPIRHKIEVSVRPAAEPLSITPYQATGLALVVNELTRHTRKHRAEHYTNDHAQPLARPVSLE
jgi:PAS domain S-box-containing protein